MSVPQPEKTGYRLLEGRGLIAATRGDGTAKQGLPPKEPQNGN